MSKDLSLLTDALSSIELAKDNYSHDAAFGSRQLALGSATALIRQFLEQENSKNNKKKLKKKL